MRTLYAIGLGLAAIVAAACSSSTSVANSCGSSGANANVNANGSLQFAPNHTTITHGQSVCWQNTAGFEHTVTSDDGTSFNSDLPAGNIFVHTFPTAGTFTYHCNIHQASGMTGTITVN
jgi:plastocyanin